MAIVYYPKSNEQFIYAEHSREIISLAVSSASNLVASGEIAENPAIHIWDCNSLQNISIIQGVHQKAVHLLTFINSDELIASCGFRPNSPIFIHNYRDGTLLVSTFVNDLAIDLGIIYSYIAELPVAPSKEKLSRKESLYGNRLSVISNPNNVTKQKSDNYHENLFFVCTQSKIIVYEYHNSNFSSSEINLTLLGIKSPLTCCWGIKTNLINAGLKAYTNDSEKGLILITGHLDGKVLIWENLEFRQELADYKSEILSICSFNSAIVIATDSSHLNFVSFLM